MGLKLNTASSGSVTIEPTNTASNYTLTVPAQTGTVVATDSSGNVGVGTSSPTPYNSGAKLIQVNSGTVNSELKVTNSTTGTAANAGLAIVQSGTTAYVWNGSNGAMGFGTNDAERMRIDSNGNVLVGTTNAAVGSSGNMRVGSGGTGSTHQGTIILDGSTATNYGPCIRYYNNNGFLADAGDYSFIVGSSTHQYAIRCGASGGVYLGNNATSWSAISDETQKNIIEPITDGLNKVVSLRSVIGSYKADETNTRHPFLIAQDVKAVLPEAVSENEHDGETILGVAYTDVIPLLVASIKELKAELDTVKTELATLKGTA